MAMSPTREQIRLALYGLLSGIGGLVTVSDVLRHWADVPGSQQPALFLLQEDSHADIRERKTGLGILWTAQFAVYIYVQTGLEGATNPVSPASLINPFIDAVEDALKPKVPDDRQTLGGLIHHACISGKVETDNGLLGNQGVAIIPIEVYYAANT